jgi:hypothetical protein
MYRRIMDNARVVVRSSPPASRSSAQFTVYYLPVVLLIIDKKSKNLGKTIVSRKFIHQ